MNWKGEGDASTELRIDDALDTIRGMDQTYQKGNNNNINYNNHNNNRNNIHNNIHKNVQRQTGHKSHNLQCLYTNARSMGHKQEELKF